MWWLLLLLVACNNAEVIVSEISSPSALNTTYSEPKNNTNDSVDITATTLNTTNTSLSNSTKKIIFGDKVRFYMSTKEGLLDVWLTEGIKEAYEGKEVEIIFVGSDNGVGKTVLRVNGELSKPLKEKESDIVGGTYIYVMEILYKS